MAQPLAQIAKDIGIHYNTLQKLSNSDTFPMKQVAGSKFMYDEVTVKIWYQNYKARDKRNLLNSTIDSFLEGISTYTHTGDKYYNLLELFQKIGHRPAPLESTSFFMLYHQIKILNDEEQYIKHTSADIIAICYLMYKDDPTNKHLIVSYANNYLIIGQGLLTQHAMDITARGGSASEANIPKDIFALDKAKKDYASWITKSR